MSRPAEVPVQTLKLIKLIKTIVPKLSADKHKGQAGRIGVIGGSLEYTGAPYFAALSAMRVGADLSHVFCQRDAAIVIKSYSPELIVHPMLDSENPAEQFQKWLDRLHVVVIGPGLGREPSIQETARYLIKMCLNAGKPLIIDADGLCLLKANIDMLYNQKNIILTPNAVEFRDIFGQENDTIREKMKHLGTGVVILKKGVNDRIFIPHTGEVYKLPEGGSGRRCGGQGDLLCGSLATFFYWSLQSNQSNPAFIASFAASYLIKQCNAAAYQKLGRGMLANDIMKEIPFVFRAHYED